MSDKRSDKLYAPKIKWLVEPQFDDDGVQRSAGLDEFNREHGDPVPMRPPLGMAVSQGDETQTLLKKMFQIEREAYRRAIEAEEFESEEDANDFFCEEDIFPPQEDGIPWDGPFDLPAGDPPPDDRRSPAAASQPPANGENRAPVDATPQPSGKVSEDLVSPSSSTEKKVETPRSGGGSVTDTGVPSEPVKRLAL